MTLDMERLKAQAEMQLETPSGFYAPDDVVELIIETKRPIAPDEKRSLHVETDEPILVVRLEVEETCREHFMIDHISVGTTRLPPSPYSAVDDAKRVPLYARVFGDFGPPLNTETMAGTKLALVVHNTSSKPQHFGATFYGRRPADMDAWEAKAIVAPLRAIAQKMLAAGVASDSVIAGVIDELEKWHFEMFAASEAVTTMYGMDTGPEGGPYKEGSRLSIEVTPFKAHTVRRFMASKSIAASVVLESLEVFNVGGKLARSAVSSRADEGEQSGGWEADDGLIVEPMDTVRLRILVTKDIERVTLCALGDEPGTEPVLRKLLRVAVVSTDNRIKEHATELRQAVVEFEERKKAQRIHKTEGDTAGRVLYTKVHCS